MAKIPFSIDYRPQIESGEYKVETRDGRPVKIISFEITDSGELPIVAQFRLCAGTPVIYLFDKNGEYKGEGPSDYDLFLVTPGPELTEFEKAVKDLYWKVCMGEEVYKDDIIKKTAAELLELARKELREELQTHEDYRDSFMGLVISSAYERGKAEDLKEFEEKYKQSWFNEGKIAGRFEGLTEDEKYQQGVHDGKEEALKDLPRWKKCNCGYCSERYRIREYEDGKAYLFDQVAQKTICIFDLKKLPKEY